MHELARMGFEVVTVAGVGPADRVVPGLGIRDERTVDRDELDAALADVDLTVVENLATIPLNLAASRRVGDVLAGRPAILHHHDPPWHRPEWSHVAELPLDDPAWRHVVISETERRHFAARGIEATRIRNAFAPPGPAERWATRDELGVGPDELLVAHPVRAIERKNVPGALRLAARLGGTYWLLGPAEDGYGPALRDALAGARCRVIHRAWPSIDDVYAAGDLVAYPSHWEGFGNPPVEAALRRRWAAVGAYPVADELRALGLRFLDPNDPGRIRRHLRRDDGPALERNRAVADEHFSLERLAADLGDLLDAAGWRP
jgi:glycosyltransferase involved in cell wall biosynthesis